MSLLYRLLYRIGFTPWDSDRVPAELAAVVEGPDAVPPGRALDVGCGTGTQAIYLAREGWDVTAVDLVDRALEAARARAGSSDLAIRWLKADVTKLPELGLAPGFTLVHDRGCFHGLPAGARDAYVDGVTSLAAPGAVFLLMAFAPNRRPGPSGADDDEIRSRFAGGWELRSAAADTAAPPAGPMRDVERTWYRLVRR